LGEKSDLIKTDTLMSNIYIMEAANLFCGDENPTASKHLTLTELQLPNLQEITQDHHPGGSRVQIEVALGIQKLEASFKLAGWDPDLLTQFGLGATARKKFTAYGSVRDKRNGVAIEAKAVLEGRLGTANPEAFQRGELQGLTMPSTKSCITSSISRGPRNTTGTSSPPIGASTAHRKTQMSARSCASPMAFEVTHV